MNEKKEEAKTWWSEPYPNVLDKNAIVLVSISGLPLTGKKQPSIEGTKVSFEEIRIERYYSVVTIPINELSLRAFYTDWHPGPYERAFRELDEVSRDFSNVDLKNVLERIRETNKGEQVVEVFGLKISSVEATRWGIAFLVAVQLYFWIHLRELTTKLQAADEGWDVAWIGVYESGSAFIATIISSCLLPGIGCLLLCFRLAKSSWNLHSWGRITIAVIVATITALLAAGTAHHLFRLRSTK